MIRMRKYIVIQPDLCYIMPAKKLIRKRGDLNEYAPEGYIGQDR